MDKFIYFKQNSRKLEFAQFYERAIGIIASYEPDSLQISSAFNEAKEGLTEAATLQIRSRKIPLTKEQISLSKQLDKAISSLLQHVRVSMLRGKSNSEAQQVLQAFLLSYLKGYARKNMYQKMSVAHKMLEHIANDSMLKATATAEQMGMIMEKISTIHSELELLYVQRRKIIAKQEHARTKEIKRILYYNLRNVFSSIEMNQLSYLEIQYDELINELNQEILRFNAGTKPQARSLSLEQETALKMENSEASLAV